MTLDLLLCLLLVSMRYMGGRERLLHTLSNERAYTAPATWPAPRWRQEHNVGIDVWRHVEEIAHDELDFVFHAIDACVVPNGGDRAISE